MQLMEKGSGITPKVQEFINNLEKRGLSDKENIRLMNLLTRFQPFGRRPLQEGDVILYQLFELSEIFRVATPADAKAIENALAKVKTSPGVNLPDDKILADRIYCVPDPDTLPGVEPTQPTLGYEEFSREEMNSLKHALFELFDNIVCSPSDKSGYDDESPEHEKRKGFWKVIQLQEDEPEPDIAHDELLTFQNELRRLLVDALVHTAVHGRSAAA